MLRAVRFATKLSTPELKFTIVQQSMDSMRRMADRLSILSKERIADELNKMLLTPRPSMAFELMEQTGLLQHILPELCALKGVETVEGRGHKENFSHSLMVLDNVAQADCEHPSLWLRWAALLHDIGKPASKRFDPAIGWTFHGHDVDGEVATQLVILQGSVFDYGLLLPCIPPKVPQRVPLPLLRYSREHTQYHIYSFE